MQIHKCSADKCDLQVVVQTYAVWRRVIRHTAIYCEHHAELFWANYDKARLSGDNDPRRDVRPGEFDVELIAISHRPGDPCWIVLREVAGKRRFDLQTGVFECAALQRTLEGIPPPRPLTHCLILDVISAYGGTLTSVVIDRKLTTDTYYTADLEIENNGYKKRIDSRPSDALVLAVKSGAPVLLSVRAYPQTPAAG